MDDAGLSLTRRRKPLWLQQPFLAATGAENARSQASVARQLSLRRHVGRSVSGPLP